MITKQIIMKSRKIVSITFIIVLVLLIVTGIFISTLFKTRLREIFKMNEVRESEGYYLSEFEFKLVGQAYYLENTEGVYYPLS